MSSNDAEYEKPGYFNCDQVDDRCRVEFTIYGDFFTQGACIFFVAMYGLLLVAQSYLGWRLKAWGFVGSLAVGASLEFVGYVCRTILSSNPWNFPAFVIQNLFLVLGPTVVAASISVTFKHLVIYYGSQWSLIKPRLYPWIFVGTDVISLLIQMAGGGVAAMSMGEDADPKMMDLGNNLMLAGVCFQVVNMVGCGGLILTYAWRRKQNKVKPTMVASDDSVQDSSDASEQCAAPAPAAYTTSTAAERLRTKRFIYGLVVAYIAIIARCAYRIPEMSMGWGSSLQKNETTFLILDGAMILTAVLVLTVLHPTLAFPYMGKHYVPVESHSVQQTGEAAEVMSERKR